LLVVGCWLLVVGCWLLKITTNYSQLPKQQKSPEPFMFRALTIHQHDVIYPEFVLGQK